MADININRIFMFFVIYSFCGWIAETIYCSLIEGKFVYRGFLNGPFCPVYGFGALFVLLFLNRLKAHPIILFLASMVITSVLEYITSYLLEKIFDMKWWDYSNKKIQINGRICLLNSVLFGLLSMFLIEIAHPTTVKYLNKFSIIQLDILGSIFFIYFSLDTLFTVLSLSDLKPQLATLSRLELDINLKIKDDLKKLNNKWENRKEKHKEDMEKIISKLPLDFSNRRLLKSYPKLKSIEYPKSIENLRKIIEKKFNYRKK